MTVVIDNFEYQAFVGTAIDSAIAQSYPNVEVVVVDDGSRDGSRQVLETYRDRVELVMKANGGQASALNAGFLSARGDIVLFLDADDFLYPNAVERVVEAFGPQVAKVHFRLDAVDAQGRPLGFTNPPADRRLDDGDVVDKVLRVARYTTPVTSGNAFARQALEQVMPIPEAAFRISADGYLVTTVPFYGMVRAIEDRLGAYRIHGANAWAPATLDAGRMQASVRHDLEKHRSIAACASATGRLLIPGLAERDHLHLRGRLASRRLDPAGHPMSGDGIRTLVRRGVLATWRYSDLNVGRKATFTAWFVGVGVAPMPVARRLVSWLYTPQARPHAVRGLVRAIRNRRR